MMQNEPTHLIKDSNSKFSRSKNTTLINCLIMSGRSVEIWTPCLQGRGRFCAVDGTFLLSHIKHALRPIFRICLHIYH
jgi:hypothetical protein